MSKKKRKYCPYCSKPVIIKNEGNILREYCPNCNSYFYDNPLPVVSAIITKERGILLVKRRYEPFKDQWCLPSGFAETGETIHEACLREVKEETGIEGFVTGLIDADSTENYFYGDLIFHTFEVEQIGGVIQAGDDAKEIKFFSIYELPVLAFHSNKKAIDIFIKNKSEYWAIFDSFSYSVSEVKIKKHKTNFLSNKLIEVIENNIIYIAGLWIQNVKTNKSTPGYHSLSEDILQNRFLTDTQNYIKWLSGQLTGKEMRQYYRELGARRRKQGHSISELLSALSLIRKHIWEFALTQGMWQKTIDIYRTLELERRMMLFFDKATYYVCKGFENHNE
ncbi:MAG: NUDIX hydrolase [Bacteroidetes bacterium]|nr:NUDIX hydrolase [Bacteroidota bacterium]